MLCTCINRCVYVWIECQCQSEHYRSKYSYGKIIPTLTKKIFKKKSKKIGWTSWQRSFDFNASQEKTSKPIRYWNPQFLAYIICIIICPMYTAKYYVKTNEVQDHEFIMILLNFLKSGWFHSSIAWVEWLCICRLSEYVLFIFNVFLFSKVIANYLALSHADSHNFFYFRTKIQTL